MVSKFSKKAVVILVVIALVLAVVSVSYSTLSSGKKLSTIIPGAKEDSGRGKVGIEVLPTEVEDKGGG